MSNVTPLEAKPFETNNEGPQPLLREIPQGADYPAHALGPLKEAVEAVQAATQAPLAIAAQSALSVASLIVQGHADAEGLSGTVPTSLFCLTVAQSGERKSGCDRIIMQAVEDHVRAQWDQYRIDKQEHEIAKRIWHAKHDRILKDLTGGNPAKATAAEADLRALEPEPAGPLSPQLTTSEPTLEGLVKLYMAGQPSLGLFSDEGGGFIGGHAMSQDNRLKTTAGLSKLWDAAPLDRVRAGDGASAIYGRRLALHLMVQPVAARPLLSDPVANGQGFLARFLITEPQSAIGYRLADTGRLATSPAIEAFQSKAREILSADLPLKDGNPQELEPKTLTLHPEARQLLLAYYKATEAAQKPGGEYESVKPFASKSPEQAARIAGVLTLWGRLEASSISPPTMAHAIALAEFYLGEAKRLVEAAVVSEEIGQADQLRRWLLDSWPAMAEKAGRDPETITPRDVVQFGPGSLRETPTVKKLMGVLASHGWLRQQDEGTLVDGKARALSYRIMGGA